jgi:DNA polymerase-3 subunit beta
MKKLIISTKDLRPALQKLSQVVVKKPVLPVLSNLFLKARPGEVELIASDLELTISYVLPCECKEEFEMLLPFDFISKLVSLLPGQPLTIELLPRNKGVITADGDIHQLGALDKTDDFPKIRDIPSRKSVTLDTSFMEWLERAMASVGKDDTRPAMTKALLELEQDTINIVSTDAHSLFRHKFPIQTLMTEQILISPKIARALQGFETTVLTWNAKHLAMKADNITIIATRHEDKFPDYKVVIPNHGANVTVLRADLISALNRASLASSREVTFHFPNDKQLQVRGADIDLERNSAATVLASSEGTLGDVLLAPELFNTLLHQIPFDEIRLHVDRMPRAVMISAEEDENYLGMIMPLQKS